MIVRELIARLGLSIDEAAFSRADALISGIGKGVLAFGTAAVAAVAIGVVALGKSAADAADHVKKLAQSTGVDSIALQEFAYSADLADVSMDELAIGLRHLAKTGVKDVRAEVLRLADQFKGMPDDGRKVELAMDKFGRAGARLIPWLNGGAKGIADLAQEARDLGLIFDTDAQNAAEEFNDNLKRLSYGFAGLRNVIGHYVLPVLNRLVLNMLAFIKGMRTAKPVIDALTLTLRVLAFVMGGALLAAVVANIGAVATAVSWYVALGVQSALAGLKAAASWAAAAAPMLALAAIMAVLLLAAEDVYYFLTEGDSLIGELGPKWSKFLDDFTKPLPTDPPWLKDAKAMLAVLTDIQGFWQSFTGESGGVSFWRQRFGTSGSTPPGFVRNATPEEIISGQFGAGGASPTAAGALAAGARGPVWVPPSFTVEKIEINAAPGMNAEEVAGAVVRQMDEHFNSKMREGAAKAE